MAIIGIIAVTLILGYVAFCFFGFGYLMFIGFDEVNIPLGIVCWILGCVTCYGWWILVGSSLSVSYTG